VPEDFPSDCWKAVLKESPQKAIKRYLRHGFLQEASLTERLDFKYRPVELRSLLKERGLASAGPKPQLIEALVKADPAGMRAAVRSLRLLRCTELGRTAAEQFLTRKRESRASAENEVLTALLQGRLREATQRIAAFEARQALPRTVGGAWERYNPATDYAVLRAIFQGRPGILGGLSSEQLECLQLAAAMMHLCGSEDCQSWLPHGFEIPLSIGNDAAARMILFSAYHRCNLASFMAAGTEAVVVHTRPNPCASCRAIAQEKYPLCEVPELPYQDCAHELGCRCMMRAA
jgi:hypothetical protein